MLPILGDLMKGFEEARQRHLPVESQRHEKGPSPLSSPRSSPSLIVYRTTRSSQYPQPSSFSVSNLAHPTNIEGTTAQPDATQSREDGDAEGNASYLAFEHHFSTNINAAWQKLDYYYNLTDETPLYRAAVFLHPRMKWRWFERHWRNRADWIKDAKHVIQELWSEYKDRDFKDLPTAGPGNSTAPMLDEDDEWTNDDDNPPADQLWMYEHEPYAQISVKDSPIPYWISKRDIWPQLTQMALDVYSTPAMSDEPERVFSMAGNLLQPRRRQLKSDGVEQMLCLKSWQKSGIIQLDRSTFTRAVADSDEGLSNTPLTTNNLLYHQHGHRIDGGAID